MLPDLALLGKLKLLCSSSGGVLIGLTWRGQHGEMILGGEKHAPQSDSGDDVTRSPEVEGVKRFVWIPDVVLLRLYIHFRTKQNKDGAKTPEP